MKSQKNIFSIFGGIALTSLMSLNAYAGDVTVTVYKSDGTPLNGVTLRHERNSGGVTTFLSSSANENSATKTVPDGSGHKFSAVWRGTTFEVGAITVSGDQHIKLYTTGVTFKATSSGNANVQNVGLRYTGGGSVSNQQGVTDTNGEYKIEMFPGTYTYNATINATVGARTLIVGGSGYAATSQTENVLISKVNFRNAGTVKHPKQGSVDATIGADYYMIPGVYNLRFKMGSNPTYSRNVDINGADFNKSAAVIRLKDHAGNPLAINSIRGGNGSSIGWHVGGVNGGNHVADGDSSVWIDISNYNAGTSTRTYEVTKNGTTSTKSQDVMTNNLVDYQTNLLTVRLQKCNEEGIEGGTMRVGSSSDINATNVAINRHWSQMEVSSNSTDASGNSSVQVFPSSFTIEMSKNASLQTKTFALAGNQTIAWTTTNVKINYKGTGSSLAYGVGSASTWWNYPANGQELLPGVLKFDFKDNGANLTDIEIPQQCTPFEKTAFIARLENSNNAALAGGTLSYYLSAWNNVATPTANNGNTVVLLNGKQTKATSRMNYLGTSQQKNDVNLASVNHVIVWKTTPITMTLVDNEGNSIDADSGSLQYYAGGWKPFAGGSTTNGSASMELLTDASAYSFAMTLNGSREQKTSWNTVANPIIPFTASKVHINYNNACSPISGATASYYAGSWKSLGVTDSNGDSNKVNMLLGGSYSFKVGSEPQRNGVVINSPVQIVQFGSSDCSSAAFAKKANVTTEAELKEVATIKLYPNPATEYIMVNVPSDKAVIEIYSMSGRPVLQLNAKKGENNISVANLISGSYRLVMSYDGKKESTVFLKK